MVNGFGDYVHLGGTQDDAAGEAFDKVAKLLGLGYPGGPEIERLARETNGTDNAAGAGGNHSRLRFPVAVTSEPFDLSFSGLKTAVRYHLENHPPQSRAERAAVAHAFQEAVVESLTARTLAVLDRYPVQHVVVCGGVARNGRLRARLADELAARRVALTVPAGELCTDNGAMIGFVGSLLLRRGRRASLGLGAAASLAEVGWES
jgi:N6-L-threonylcarbamoyladenine synthase